MIALRSTVLVIGTVLLEAVTVVALVTIGRRPELAVPVGHLGPWLRDGDPATVVVALLRWVALVGAAWLLVSTVLYLAAAMSRIPAAVRSVRWSTVPAVRRAVDAACAVSVVTSVVLAPTVAGATGATRASDPPSVSLVRDGRGGSGGIADLPSDRTSPPSTAPPSAGIAATPVSTRPPVVRSATVAPTTPEEVVVLEGENLWTIAASHLAQVSGRAPADVPDAEIALYWARVCDANRARLASGDPDLVFPGEAVVLPDLS
jgi:hypothetical protein